MAREPWTRRDLAPTPQCATVEDRLNHLGKVHRF